MTITTSVTWEQVLSTFQRHWGYDSFRKPQDDIIKALLDRRDLLVILPTPVILSRNPKGIDIKRL